MNKHRAFHCHFLTSLYLFNLILSFIPTRTILHFTKVLSNYCIIMSTYFILLFKIFYLFIFRERARKEERERNTNVLLPFLCPLLGTWPTTQACVLTGNQTRGSLVHRLALNPLSHTSQGNINLV